VCIHTQRGAIDQDLADAISYRDIAQHYGLSKSAVMRHWQQCAPQVAPVPGHAMPPAPAPPCTCPCTRIDWAELAHDVQQLGTYLQKAQTPDQAWHYLKFYLLRFAALIASVRVSGTA
jgi:hypothetical protein